MGYPVVSIEGIRDFARGAHEGQVDQQGKPYIEHVERVAGAVSVAAKPVAYLHDVFEDCPLASRHEVGAMLSDDEFAALDLLTRHGGQTYANYILRIRGAHGRAGELAREVKVADLRDHLDRLTPAAESLRGRYERALAALASSGAGRLSTP